MLKSFQRDSLDIERYCVKKDVLQLVPGASVLASKFALQFLEGFVCDRNYWRVVKTSDRIDIIKRHEIEFVSAPNLHWTDRVFICDRKGSATSYQSQRNRVCYCIRCNYYFKEIPPARTCQCTIPGQDKGCHGCPNFERFMEHISKQLLELEHLNVAQLQGFLPHKH